MEDSLLPDDLESATSFSVSRSSATSFVAERFSIFEEAENGFDHPREAATYVGMAWEGHEGQNLLFSPLFSKRSLIAHRRSRWLSFFTDILVLGLVALSFITQPRWLSEELNAEEDVSIYPMWFDANFYLSANTASLIELIILPVIVVDLSVKKWLLGEHAWPGKEKNRAAIIPYWIQCIDMVVYLLEYVLNGFLLTGTFRELVHILRILLFICRSQQLCNLWATTFKILYAAKDVFIFQAIFVLLTGWFALCMFSGSKDIEAMGSTMDAYGDFVWEYFVLLSTVNSPDVMVGMYDTSRLSSLFFMFYVAIGIFFLMNLILGTIVELFYKFKESAARAQHITEQDYLRIAFTAMDKESRGFVTFGQIKAMFHEMQVLKLIKKSAVRKFIIEMGQVVRDFHDPVAGPSVVSPPEEILEDANLDLIEVDQKSFEDCVGLLLASIYLRPRKSQVEKYFPRCYSSSGFQKFKYFVCDMKLPRKHFLDCLIGRAKVFEIIVDIIIVANLSIVITSIFTCNEALFSNDCITSVSEFIFLVLYDVELIVKVVCYGWWRYWGSPINKFDFYNIIAYNILMIPITIIMAERRIGSHFALVGMVHTVLLFRIFRVFYSLEKSRIIIKRFVGIGYQLRILLLLIFTYIFVADSTGVLLFGGKICEAGLPYRCSLEAIDSTYAQEDYYSLNFNDMFGGFVTVFVLLVVNSWNIFCEAFVRVTGTRWAQLYFVFNYVCGVVVILNVVIAFVITTVITRNKVSRKKKVTRELAKNWDYNPSEQEIHEAITPISSESSDSLNFILVWARNPRYEDYRFTPMARRIYDNLRSQETLQRLESFEGQEMHEQQQTSEC